MQKYKLEICVDSLDSSIEAERGGADRLELCGNMFEGGTTPSYGVLSLTKEAVKIPIYAMVRPRGGDFCYTNQEFLIMKREVEMMRELKIDGIVFGILNPDGSVDTKRCEELMKVFGSDKITFHRAFDVTSNMDKALDDIISLGFERILTSGGEANVMTGIINLKHIIESAKDKIIIMPGSGVNERNIKYIKDTLNAKEYHMQANRTIESLMEFRQDAVFMGATLRAPEYSYKQTDNKKVTKIKNELFDN